MIYMRDKKDKKKDQNNLFVKRLILDQIKHKITQNCQSQGHRDIHHLDKNKNKNIDKPKQPVLYQIASKGQRNNDSVNFSSQKICESIVIEDNSRNICEHCCPKKRPNLYLNKCFDIQVVNLLDNAEEMETYMKLAEKYKDQANRLSQQNQQLVAMLSDMEKSRQKEYSFLTTRREQEKCHLAEHFDSFSQTEGNQLRSAEGNRSPLDALSKSDVIHEFQPEQHWKEQLNSRQSRIKNLQIEKQYLSDQMISLEKDLEELQKAYTDLNYSRNKMESENNILNIKCQRFKKQLQIKEVELSAVIEQKQLQKSKIRDLEEKGINSLSHSPMGVKSRYVELPQTDDNVTIEVVLKFLKKKELKKYHEALMELINKYEYQLSELKVNYMQERQLRDMFLKYSQKIYGMISIHPLSLEDLVSAISKYEQQIKHLKENEIDILLRRVKSLSIGIDQDQIKNIQMELEQYVYQLQARLPTLSEEYFQDGSSVADSHHASLEI